MPRAMYKKIVEAKTPKSKVEFKNRVTSIALVRDEDHSSTGVNVKAKQTYFKGDQKKMNDNANEEPQQYAAVFNTTTLACLQRMDLTELELLYEQKDAIRALHYDTASKVGVKFKKPWWREYGITKGGLGKTDMPIRCWFVSYNIQMSLHANKSAFTHHTTLTTP